MLDKGYIENKDLKEYFDIYPKNAPDLYHGWYGSKYVKVEKGFFGRLKRGWKTVNVDVPRHIMKEVKMIQKRLF